MEVLEMKQNSLVLSVLFVVGIDERRRYSKLVNNQYKTKVVYSVQSMGNVLNTQTPDLIIIDHDLIKTILDEDIIKSTTGDRKIPIILLVNSQDDAVHGLDFGIADYFIKPMIPELLMNRIKVHMKFAQEIKLSTRLNIRIHDMLKQKSEELIKMQSSIIGVLSEAIEFRDFDIETHNLRTQAYIEIMIRKMLVIPNIYQREIGLWDIESHILSSQLHDIGKIGIPDEVLLKKTPLTKEEFIRIQEHVNIGERIINKILNRSGQNTYLEIAKKYIVNHHEYWNGDGYPNRLFGTNIPLEGRIIAVVDVYDALTSARPYKIAESHQNAVATINAASGIHFDPEVVRIFNMVSSQFKGMLK